ncbi:hypothetical protein DYH09_15425 [bacterium CPR1]|nr:hypothetical protein [bacterium CPR1]
MQRADDGQPGRGPESTDDESDVAHGRPGSVDANDEPADDADPVSVRAADGSDGGADGRQRHDARDGRPARRRGPARGGWPARGHRRRRSPGRRRRRGE